MSEEPSFEDLIDNLQNHPDASTRAEAARILGAYVAELDDDEYARAHAAIQRALSDPDPMVLTTALQALGQYNRSQGVEETHEPDATEPIITSSTCAVCGRPEALIDADTCTYDNCPYK